MVRAMSSFEGSGAPALVSIGASKSHILLVEKMHELGYAVISVDRDPNGPAKEYSDEALDLSTFEAAPIIAALDEFEGRYDIKGVFTRSSGPPVVTTGAVADHLGLRSVTEEAAAIIVNKNRLMDACRSKGIAAPEGVLLDGPGYAGVMARNLPCVVKPTLSLVGKGGITLVRDEPSIEGAFRAAAEASYEGSVMMESYVAGDDVVFVSVVYDGRVTPVVILREWNEFAPDGSVAAGGFSMPYDPGAPLSRALLELAQSIVDVTGVGYGPFSVSCRCAEGLLPVLIEIHLDFGGDDILDELFPRSTDFDFIKYAIKAALGASEPKSVNTGSFRYARIGPPGTARAEAFGNAR